MTVNDSYPLVARKSRWAPYVQVHGLGQGQFPQGCYRPQGNSRLTHPTAALSLYLRIILGMCKGSTHLKPERICS